jgi:hypothetical protein
MSDKPVPPPDERTGDPQDPTNPDSNFDAPSGNEDKRPPDIIVDNVQ